MCKKEVISDCNPSNRKFLREKIKSNLKFKAKNWDFDRKEWNNYRYKSTFLCKSDLLTEQWGEKKNLIRELCYRGKEKRERESAKNYVPSLLERKDRMKWIERFFFFLDYCIYSLILNFFKGYFSRD